MFKPRVAKEDLQKSQLPSTRKAQFFDIVKLNIGKLLLLSLIIFLFCLPIHILAIAEDLYQANLIASLGNKPTSEQSASVVASIMTFNLIRNAINIPLLALVAIGLGGVARILRQLCWGEGFSFFHDFFKGVKENAAQYAIIGALAGLLNLLANYISNVSATATAEVYQWLGIIPAVVFILLLGPIAGFAMVSICCYSNSFFNNMRIGRVCYFRTFFRSLLALAICLLPFVANYIPNFYSHIIGRGLSTLLIPFIYLGWMLFAFTAFDQYVNPNNHPELVNKGLYTEEETPQEQEQK